MLTCLICHSSDNKCSQIKKNQRIIRRNFNFNICLGDFSVTYIHIYINIHELGMVLLINFNGIPHTTVWAVSIC